MDLALEYVRQSRHVLTKRGFNPCFNGSCSRILSSQVSMWTEKDVSILVLMDLALECFSLYTFTHSLYCFNPCFNGSCSRIAFIVSVPTDAPGFNPCFNGSCSRMFEIDQTPIYRNFCFNPCFNGSCSRIQGQPARIRPRKTFQSLF